MRRPSLFHASTLLCALRRRSTILSLTSNWAKLCTISHVALSWNTPSMHSTVPSYCLNCKEIQIIYVTLALLLAVGGITNCPNLPRIERFPGMQHFSWQNGKASHNTQETQLSLAQCKKKIIALHRGGDRSLGPSRSRGSKITTTQSPSFSWFCFLFSSHSVLPWILNLHGSMTAWGLKPARSKDSKKRKPSFFYSRQFNEGLVFSGLNWGMCLFFNRILSQRERNAGLLRPRLRPT